MPIRTLMFVLPLFLMGCVPEDDPALSDDGPILEPELLETPCGAESLQSLVWQSAKVLETMRFAHTVRIIRPGMAVTMDYSPDRLNIEVNAGEIITRVSCG